MTTDPGEAWLLEGLPDRRSRGREGSIANAAELLGADDAAERSQFWDDFRVAQMARCRTLPMRRRAVEFLLGAITGIEDDVPPGVVDFIDQLVAEEGMPPEKHPGGAAHRMCYRMLVDSIEREQRPRSRRRR